MILHCIYELSDPRTGRPRYVGKTKEPKTRLQSHIRLQRSGGMARWIKELSDAGLTPVFTVIEECLGDTWIERERFHVADYKGRFPDLLNVLPGGVGPVDAAWTEEVRTKIGDARRGKKLSMETRAKISDSLRGHVVSAETRAKIGEKSKGRALSSEHLAKLSAAHRGRKATTSTRAKISAAQRGRKHSPESRAKMRLAKLGRKLSPEHCANMSAALIGKNSGRKFTPEHRAKLSAAARNRKSKFQ